MDELATKKIKPLKLVISIFNTNILIMISRIKYTLFTLFLLLIPISALAETADAERGSVIKEVGIDMGLKLFVESTKKTLPKKIDEITIFTNIEASRSNISHHYKILVPAKEFDVKSYKKTVTNYFISTVCETESSRFLLDNVETISYLYKDVSDVLFLSLDFSKNDCITKTPTSTDVKPSILKKQLGTASIEDLAKLMENDEFVGQVKSRLATDKDSPIKNVTKKELREAFTEVAEPRFTTKQNDPAWYMRLLKVGIKSFMAWSVLLIPLFFLILWANWPKKEK